MGEKDFSVDMLMHNVGMSRTQLHSKLKALINQSATQFIQSIRLQRAADLIRQHSGTLAEIAYEVGFADPSYFAKLFKRQFGVAPSEYGEDGVS